VAISTLAKSSIGTFDKFNKTSAGNVSATGVFAFADGTSTYRTSPDGLTWTSFTTPGSVTGLFLTYHSARNGWQWWNGSTAPIYWNKNLYLTRMLSFSSSNSATSQYTPYNSGLFQSYFGANTYFGINSGSRVSDENFILRQQYVSAPYSGSMTRPAWDGATTWAVLSSQKADPQWARFTSQGTSGDGIMPVELEAATPNGWSAWGGFYSPPTGGQFIDLFYWQGYWFALNTSGTVFRTANIATASPTWTTMTTLTNAFGAFQVANNELWVLSAGSGSTTANKLTSPTGSWASVTLPATKSSNNIVYGNGAYVIFNNDGTVYRSTTGASGSFSNVSTGSTASYSYRLTGGFGPSNA
jgi:hypothetical protein